METAAVTQALEHLLPLFKTSIPVFVTVCAAGGIVFLLTGIALGSAIQRARLSARIKREREDAVRKSRAVLGGQFAEQLAPYLPGFPCSPADVQFLGKPVDYVAFPGSAEGKPVTDVLFIEVKTGSSTLSERERQIKKAIEAGRVHYVEYRLQPTKNK